MSNYIFDYDKEYNVTPASHLGGGTLTVDSTYEEVSELPSDTRQDRFYKIEGSDGLYWYSGPDQGWINLTDTIIKSGIVYVDTLPTDNINNEIIYSVTGSGVLLWWNGSTWLDVSTNHVVTVDTLPSTAPSNVVYNADDKLYWYNGLVWIDISTDNGIITVNYLADVVCPRSTNLYWCTYDDILYWHDGVEWHDCSTNYGIVEVNSLPSNPRQNCFYKTKTEYNDNRVFWWDGVKWHDVTHHPGIMLTDTRHEDITNPEPDVLYNYSGDNALWWFDEYDLRWVNLAANDAVRIVNGLPTTDIRQNYIYYDISRNPPTLYWYDTSKWVEISTNYGVVEVNSLPLNPRRDCLYAEPDTEADSLYWYDGAQWHKIARHTGVEIVSSLPIGSNINTDNLYFISEKSSNYDGALWWHDPKTGEWHDLALNNGIVEVQSLPTVNIRSNCIYRNTIDHHIYYYYEGTWACLDKHNGIFVVDQLPTTNQRQDCIFKERTTNKLYWWNGSRWIDITAHGGMTTVTALPLLPIDDSVLYKLTEDTALYSKGIYAWLDSRWWSSVIQKSRAQIEV